MPVAGPGLLLLTIAAIALLLFLILVVKLHAFLSLLISSMALGLAAGMAPAAVLKSIQSGFGEALGFIAVVVGLGAMIGRFIENSGGGRVLADWLLGKFGRERAVWALLVAAYLVGLPIFFEVGFIILAPLVWSLARESKRSLLFYGMPVAAALSVQPTRWCRRIRRRSAAAQLLGADLGRIILYGVARLPSHGHCGRNCLRRMDRETHVHPHACDGAARRAGETRNSTAGGRRDADPAVAGAADLRGIHNRDGESAVERNCWVSSATRSRRC